METQKIKKGQMQVARIIIFMVFTLFVFNKSNGQIISGEFKVIDNLSSVKEIGITYNFKPNGIFRHVIHEHMNKKTISGGNFKTKGDTLILDYKPLKKKILAGLSYLKKKDLQDSNRFFSNIQVVNSKGNPQAGVNLLIKNRDENIVIGFSSNNQGKYPTLSIYDSYIQYLTFSFLGHREITINADSLFGLETKLRVQLQDDSVIWADTKKSVRFVFKKSTDGLKLNPLDGYKKAPLQLTKISTKLY